MKVPGSQMRALFFLFFALVGLRVGAQGQTSDIPSALTLENAIRIAIDRNPTLAAAKNEIQAAEGDRIAAGKKLNPAFSLQFEDFPISAHPGPFFDVQEITSRVDYEIERGGRRKLRAESASQALAAQKLAFDDQARLMRLEVERAFFSGSKRPGTVCRNPCRSAWDRSQPRWVRFTNTRSEGRGCRIRNKKSNT
jgi:outer membrane protein TolC